MKTTTLASRAKKQAEWAQKNTFSWDEINEALMKQGKSPKQIADFLYALKKNWEAR